MWPDLFSLRGESDILLSDFGNLRVKLNQTDLLLNGRKYGLIHVVNTDIASKNTTKTRFPVIGAPVPV